MTSVPMYIVNYTKPEEWLFSLPLECIFALEHPFEKRVYISHTTRLPAVIGNMAMEMRRGTWRHKDMIENRNYLQLVILEQHDTKSKHFVQYFVKEYLKQGYTIYNEDENLPQSHKFQLEYTILPDIRADWYPKLNAVDSLKEGVAVMAVSRGYQKTLLGRFETNDEAKRYLEQVVLKDNPAGSLVFKI